MQTPIFNRANLFYVIALAVVLFIPTAIRAQQKIVFESQRDGNNEIYLMDADGANQLRLTTNTFYDAEPAFSATGEKIAFTSTRSGNAEIYVMNTDGSMLQNLTNNPATDGHPAFSPDGSKIVFISTRLGHLGIWVMNVDGSNPVELMDGFGGNEPEFSPDGTKVVFSGTGGSGGDSEIWIMNADGTSRNNLTQDPDSQETEPSFSPDGTKIIFTKNPKSGSSEIFTMNLNGSNPVNLTNHPSSDAGAEFNGDGTRIFFTTFRDGQQEIYQMNPDGSNQVNVTNKLSNDSNASWGPANSRPTINNFVATSPIDEGEVTRLSGEIADADANDSFTLTINWGDGILQTFEYPAGTTNFEIPHLYLDDPDSTVPNDNYLIMYIINDHRFGVNSAVTEINVNNVSPLVYDSAVAPATIAVGGTVTLTSNYFDVGYHGSPTDENLQVLVSWGDGQTKSVVTGGIPGTLQETHQYLTAGSFTITIRATDNDGGVGVETLDVTVTGPTPPAVPGNFRVASASSTQIQLAWTDASNNEDGFAIERCNKKGCTNFVEVGRVASNSVSYIDSTLIPNSQYFYRMRSFNTGGASSYTPVVAGKTLRK
jgi:Tol biopolymer transport system component